MKPEKKTNWRNFFSLYFLILNKKKLRKFSKTESNGCKGISKINQNKKKQKTKKKKQFKIKQMKKKFQADLRQFKFKQKKNEEKYECVSKTNGKTNKIE